MSMKTNVTRDRGQTLVLFALFLVALIGSSAVAVDRGDTDLSGVAGICRQVVVWILIPTELDRSRDRLEVTCPIARYRLWQGSGREFRLDLYGCGIGYGRRIPGRLSGPVGEPDLAPQQDTELDHGEKEQEEDRDH